MLEVPLKPLSQHERITSISPEVLDKLPLSSIRIAGNFSYSDGVQWIANCLPNVSASQSEISQQATFFFKSCFTQTYLILEVRSKLVTVKSDNLSAITIVKDQLSLDASNRKLALDIKSDLNEDSVFHMLSILNPIIVKQLEVAKKWMLIDAIKELTTGEEDISFLSSEYKDILRDETLIR